MMMLSGVLPATHLHVERSTLRQAFCRTRSLGGDNRNTMHSYRQQLLQNSYKPQKALVEQQGNIIKVANHKAIKSLMVTVINSLDG